MGTNVANLGANVLAATGVFTNLPKITTPNSQIIGRAQCVDPSNDHQPRFGINRAMFQAIQIVQNEQGPAAQTVYKPVNDFFDQVRFCGYWTNNNATYGPVITAPNSATTDFIEITFYGTGINLLANSDSGATISVSVDGGSATSVAFSANSALAGHNYNGNVIYSFSQINGLAQGLHTVRITGTGTGNAIALSGYEVVTNATTLQYVPGVSYTGSLEVANLALSTDSYNSNFASGTLSAQYGGHVVVYQTTSGIAKAVQSNSGGALYLTNANHTNESVIRQYHFREFGAGRTDDMSYLGSTASNRTFTLDDNCTTLMGYQVNTGPAQAGNTENIAVAANGVITFQFVGTGCDAWGDYGGGGAIGPVYVDGVSVGTYVRNASAGGLVKLVSGLPYGTHTIQMSYTASADYFGGLIVYGPSKPAVPAGAVELSDYYILGSFSANTTQNFLNISQGVIRKSPFRELQLSGSFTVGSLSIGSTVGGGSTGSVTGSDIYSTTTGNYIQYTFFGTGFDFRMTATNTATSLTVTVNGSTPSSLGATTGSYGAATSFVASTGVITLSSANNYASGAYLTGLPLGLYTVKISLTTAGVLQPEALDIITPIHSPKLNGPGIIQAGATVGGCALGDSRKFSTQIVNSLKGWSQAQGVANQPTTTTTSLYPMPDMTCIIKTTGNPLEVSYSAGVSNSSVGGVTELQVAVDGVLVGQQKNVTSATASAQLVVSDTVVAPVSAGVHVVQLWWNVNVGTATASNTYRNIRAREIT